MTVEKLDKLNDMSATIIKLKKYRELLDRTYSPFIKIYSPVVSATEIYLDDVLTDREINNILSLVYKEVKQKLEKLEKEFNEL